MIRFEPYDSVRIFVRMGEQPNSIIFSNRVVLGHLQSPLASRTLDIIS